MWSIVHVEIYLIIDVKQGTSLNRIDSIPDLYKMYDWY